LASARETQNPGSTFFDAGLEEFFQVLRQKAATTRQVSRLQPAVSDPVVHRPRPNAEELGYVSDLVNRKNYQPELA
jgi:hypothetical protein